jgi:hypothetical protein
MNDVKEKTIHDAFMELWHKMADYDGAKKEWAIRCDCFFQSFVVMTKSTTSTPKKRRAVEIGNSLYKELRDADQKIINETYSLITN